MQDKERARTEKDTAAIRRLPFRTRIRETANNKAQNLCNTAPPDRETTLKNWKNRPACAYNPTKFLFAPPQMTDRKRSDKTGPHSMNRAPPLKEPPPQPHFRNGFRHSAQRPHTKLMQQEPPRCLHTLKISPSGI